LFARATGRTGRVSGSPAGRARNCQRISEAAKTDRGCTRFMENLHATKVTQAMLSVGNDKLQLSILLCEKGGKCPVKESM